MTTPAPPRAPSAAPLLLLALVAFALPRLAMLTVYPPWQDEIWTLEVLRRDFPTMLRWIVADQTHPPLFYTLAWVWRRVGGEALWWMRLLPALIGIGAAVPLVALCRAARFDARATLLAVLLCAGSPWLVFYSVELRDYGLYAALAIASLAAWLRARDAERGDRTRWIVLMVVNVALVHSHYFGWLIVAAEGADALLFARRRVRAFLRATAWTALAFAPWVALVVQRAVRYADRLDVVSWIPRPGVADLLDPYRLAFGVSAWPGVDLALVVASGGVIAWSVMRSRAHVGAAAATLALAAMLPVALAWLASVAGPRSMWVPRYLLAVAPLFLVLVAGSLTAALPARMRALALVLAAWPASLTAWHAVRRDDKVPFDALARAIAEREPATDRAPVFALSWVEGGPLAWVAAHGAAYGVAPFEVATLAGADSVNVPRAWVVWNAAAPPAGPTPTARLVRRGYRVDGELFVRGMNDSVVAIAVRRAR